MGVASSPNNAMRIILITLLFQRFDIISILHIHITDAQSRSRGMHSKVLGCERGGQILATPISVK